LVKGIACGILGEMRRTFDGKPLKSPFTWEISKEKRFFSTVFHMLFESRKQNKAAAGMSERSNSAQL
jgi:hypothetical protein